MLAIIFDKSGRLIKEIKGKVVAGDFTYREGPLAWLTRGRVGKQIKIPCDLSKTLQDRKGQSLVYYSWNGKVYKQMAFKELEVSGESKFSYKDYLTNYQIYELKRKLTQAQPKGLLVYLPTITAILLFLSVVGFGMVMNNMWAQFTTSMKPLNSTLIFMQHHTLILENMTTQLMKLYNKTLQR